MSYKIPEWQLPRELQFYAKGTGDFPTGHFSQTQIKSAVKYRQTFFRRLQAYRPGLQYQWPDYQTLMSQEILSYAKRVLRPMVMKMWDQLTGHNSRLGTLYRHYIATRFKNSGPMSLARRERLIREVKEKSFLEAIRDPRTLGSIEEAVVGKAFYGIPTVPRYLAN